jgi:hypothetical protein
LGDLVEDPKFEKLKQWRPTDYKWLVEFWYVTLSDSSSEQPSLCNNFSFVG